MGRGLPGRAPGVAAAARAAGRATLRPDRADLPEPDRGRPHRRVAPARHSLAAHPQGARRRSRRWATIPSPATRSASRRGTSSSRPTTPRAIRRAATSRSSPKVVGGRWPRRSRSTCGPSTGAAARRLHTVGTPTTSGAHPRVTTLRVLAAAVPGPGQGGVAETFFFDRNLGHRVPEGLRARGCSVELHDDHLGETTPPSRVAERRALVDSGLETFSRSGGRRRGRGDVPRDEGAG